jgi:hypothetical protein
MKETDLVRALVVARVRFYRTITYVLLGVVTIAVLCLCGTIYLPTHSEPEVTTILISITSGLFGSLVTILTQGIQAARKIRSDEELQAEVERIAYQEATGTKLPPGIFIQTPKGSLPPEEEKPTAESEPKP